jgi:hypothetical protein
MVGHLIVGQVLSRLTVHEPPYGDRATGFEALAERDWIAAAKAKPTTYAL